QFCDLNVAERQHCPERTGMRAPLERYCPLISGAKGAPRSCPAGCIAEVGLWWCGATPRNRTEDLDVKACKEATDGVSASHRSNDKTIATADDVGDVAIFLDCPRRRETAVVVRHWR